MASHKPCWYCGVEFRREIDETRNAEALAEHKRERGQAHRGTGRNHRPRNPKYRRGRLATEAAQAANG